jgi:hypothetical protein
MPDNYRTFVYHADVPEGKIIELADKVDLETWLKNNPGWVQNPIDLAMSITELKDEPVKKTVPEKPENMKIERVIKDQVELLLSGQKVEGRIGLSLSSFCALYGITPSYTGKIEAKRPIYEAVLKVYQEKRKLWCHNGTRWFFWGVNPYKKGKKKGKK